MGNGNRSGFMGGGDSGKASLLECDVGLGLKMKHTESYSCTGRKMTVMPHHSPYHHPSPASSSSFGGGYGNSSGSGPIFCNSSQQVACVSGIYDAVGAAGSVSGGAVLPRTLLPFTSDTYFKSSGGVMAGKVLFTATQWQELERQTFIYKYMMASIPVPPELLIPFTKSPSHVPIPQSNTAGVDLRFSSGSDPEPWRCRRTDGKKWRCSRDVAPDQKYCERHAHKTRPRSRKPVEIHSHATTNAVNQKNNYTHLPPSPILPAYTTNQSFEKPTSQFPDMVSATSYDQPRCIEWFMKSGTDPVSSSTLQFQELMQSSPRLGSKRNSTHQNKNTSSVFQQNYQEEHELYMSYNPYLNSTVSDTADTTRHFIDAWSRGGKEKCSLTLSMQSDGNGIDEDNEIFQKGVGMMDSDRGSGEVLKSQTHWPNPAAWMGSPHGGPLGEALCLGIASTAKGASNVLSPDG